MVAAAGTSACGNKEPETLHGTTEGAYLDLAGMKYQVQISRQLNPASIEDRYYLIGLPANDRQLPVGQEWFAVFVRVENDGDKRGARGDRLRHHRHAGRTASGRSASRR